MPLQITLQTSTFRARHPSMIIKALRTRFHYFGNTYAASFLKERMEQVKITMLSQKTLNTKLLIQKRRSLNKSWNQIMLLQRQKMQVLGHCYGLATVLIISRRFTTRCMMDRKWTTSLTLQSLLERTVSFITSWECERSLDKKNSIIFPKPMCFQISYQSLEMYSYKINSALNDGSKKRKVSIQIFHQT